MNEPAEIKYKPESAIELKYFSRIQVLNLQIAKQNKIIKAYERLTVDLRDENKQKTQTEIKKTKEFERWHRQKEGLEKEIHRLRAQISEMITQKVNALKQ